ncbi:hypothetical protein [Streptomyces sp. SP2-10]|uniref:hypothetical protein n=1 Tax=Streptomyces sp. SP2-10 TaxID=2873385 RepID=UPI001CA673AE|nr:hypothetical protein [Streptomyces sp. SP2-10]MBY8846924.1 hypothetical protein [Streptomyces sp. SP2-10]
MIYSSQRAKDVPDLGALPGQEGPFGHWPELGETDDTDAEDGLVEPAVAVVPPRSRYG